ncbi:MAG: helix-hairpin-helix domain-containing protein [Myxococcota bacterium]
MTTRSQAAALLVLAFSLSGIGVLWRMPRDGRLPSPCADPARGGGRLRCDGRGKPPGARAVLIGHKLDVNRADVRELSHVPGVSAKLAARIVAHRERKGPFATLEKLRAVRGIGAKTVQKLAPFLTTGP